MFAKAPEFWYRPQRTLTAGLLNISLRPLYQLVSFLRQKAARSPYRSQLPVICVGNLVAGGSGKTPTCLAIGTLLKEKDRNVCFLTRGYGGRLSGPILVDHANHSASDVGDEAMLLAEQAPTIVAKNRAAGAKLAEQHGFDIIVMDDGLQNPQLVKNCNLVVVDGKTGFGNSLMIPAGPLRESLATGLEKADGFILIGDDPYRLEKTLLGNKPVFRAVLEVKEEFQPAPDNRHYIAFAGIAHPEKFRETLDSLGVELHDFRDFPDHHQFTDKELQQLLQAARSNDCHLITTEKDAARLPVEFRFQDGVETLPVTLCFKNEAGLLSFLEKRP